MNSPSKLKSWFLLFRPWSYAATLVPFLVAAGLAAEVESEPSRWGSWALGLVAGIFLQATVNLLNTWGDERSGVDDAPGAIRTTPQIHDGIVSMRALFMAAMAVAAAGALFGLAACVYSSAKTCELLSLGGDWHFNSAALAAGFVGMLGSTNYSTGIKFKYRGLGVPFVSVLMGPLEIFAAIALIKPAFTAKCFWSMGDFISAPGIIAIAQFLLMTLPVASLVGVIMHGNDMRDIPSDRAAGIVTLASRLGPKGALNYYRAAHIIPYFVCALFVSERVFAAALGASLFLAVVFLVPFLCLPLTVKTLRLAGRVHRANPDSPPWRGLERASGKIHLVFGALYALAWAMFSA